jgi:predicted nucleic acid-binding protein
MRAAPRRIVVDSGPIIALFDAADAYHDAAIEFVRLSGAKLISSMAVVTEAMYVLDESLQARKNLSSWVPHAVSSPIHRIFAT